MATSVDEKVLRKKYQALEPELDERGRRIWAATEAAHVGFGGIALVARATGLAESTVRLGKRDLETKRGTTTPDVQRRVRRQGGGRKRLTDQDPGLAVALERLVEPSARGHPMSPLRWTLKSTRRLAEELARQGHPLSHAKVGAILDDLGYSLQSTRKVLEGTGHPDRNAQFEYIAAQVVQFQRRGQPVVSMDTKKKELVGDFANRGREYRPQGKPWLVRVHDFEDEQLGKAIPYGVYDLAGNCGWVSVGVDHDTAEFAVSALRRWWRRMGRPVCRCQGASDHGRRGR